MRNIRPWFFSLKGNILGCQSQYADVFFHPVTYTCYQVRKVLYIIN
jgi:hypothetical protein